MHSFWLFTCCVVLAGDGDEGENGQMWDFFNASASGEQVQRQPRLLRTGSDNWSSQSAPAGSGRDKEFSFTAMSEESNETAELEQKLAAAEAQVQVLKKQLIELATRVHQTLQQPSTAADADKGPLLAIASQALSMAFP